VEYASISLVLDKVSFLPDPCCWDTGVLDSWSYYQEGSRMSHLVVLFGESSNSCLLCIMFLGCSWLLSKWCFIPCVYSHDNL
jgi:hypothetical protein